MLLLTILMRLETRETGRGGQPLRTSAGHAEGCGPSSRGQEGWEALAALHRPQIRARLAQVTHRMGCGKPTAGMPTDS